MRARLVQTEGAPPITTGAPRGDRVDSPTEPTAHAQRIPGPEDRHTAKPASKSLDRLHFARLARAAHAEAVTRRLRGLEALAASLGVATIALLEMEVGIDASGVSTWPMHGLDGEACGIRLRLPSGRKLAVPGSRSGYFASALQPGGGPLLIVEGASDTAAALTLGFDVVGRASAHPGPEADAGALERCKARDVVVIPDRDEVGIAGARSFAIVALLRARSVRWLLPPRSAKDLRAALCAGLTREELRQEIASTQPVRPRIEVIG